MKITLGLLLLIVLSTACGSAGRSEPADLPHGESANWKITILSATRGELPASSNLRGTHLNVELTAEYVGPEKDAPFEKVTASSGGKDLKYVSYSGNIMERMQGKKYNETYSFEDPGPDASQFALKYGDVAPINFGLMAKKNTNANQ
jgi:hypothetical protein